MTDNLTTFRAIVGSLWADRVCEIVAEAPGNPPQKRSPFNHIRITDVMQTDRDGINHHVEGYLLLNRDRIDFHFRTGNLDGTRLISFEVSEDV